MTWLRSAWRWLVGVAAAVGLAVLVWLRLRRPRATERGRVDDAAEGARDIADATDVRLRGERERSEVAHRDADAHTQAEVATQRELVAITAAVEVAHDAAVVASGDDAALERRDEAAVAETARLRAKYDWRPGGD